MASTATEVSRPSTETAWLEAVHGLLQPLAPRGVALVGGDDLAPERSWLEEFPESGGNARHPATFDGRGPGWLLRLPGATEDRRGLLLALDAAAVDDEAGAILATATVRLAWRLRRHRYGQGATLARSETDEAMHALRNGINSVLMVSAVFASAALPETLRPFAADLQNAGRRSQTSLSELALLLEQD